ncbi:hypothetical protein K469DRAFT_578773 [Zopfia rhizophila CBS 207.26]|uniref:N-acetylglucosamine-induced protein 1 n=1 Tax=Zopfia rhizophila CBS 207.26 TaxID=1314779 RepID=A0A6A6E330_9PEZI|nr:hypothetical protein K469DRAFT_578773 [Zopfia rhizophila CBS 207.26]
MTCEEKTEELAPFELSEVDRQVLGMTDAQFVPDNWNALKAIIVSNKLENFRRYPSDLKRYIKWTRKTKAEYGTMTKYMCERRLHWTSQASDNSGNTFTFKNPRPLVDPDDYKILFNDWPYGFTPDIVHLVVWSKVPFGVKPDTGEVSDESKVLIEDFVQKTFVARLGKERVLWFKNWTKLQSVRAVEHFHVLVRGADSSLLQEWTNGDVRDLTISQD